MHEDQSLDAAGLKQGMHVVIEPGAAPLSSEITLSVTHHNPVTKWTDMELTVDKSTKLSTFLQVILKKASLQGN